MICFFLLQVQPSSALKQNNLAADVSECDHATKVFSVLPKYFFTTFAATKHSLNIRRSPSFQSQSPGFLPGQMHGEASAQQNLQTHSCRPTELVRSQFEIVPQCSLQDSEYPLKLLVVFNFHFSHEAHDSLCRSQSVLLDFIALYKQCFQSKRRIDFTYLINRWITKHLSCRNRMAIIYLLNSRTGR